MVLKILLAFLIFTTAWADTSRRDAALYQRAYQEHQQKNFSTSLQIIRQNYDLLNYDAPSAILLLAAFNFEALNDPSMARSIYERLIQRRYDELHIGIIRQYQNDGHAFDLAEVPKPLAQLYERLAETNYKIYLIHLEDFSSDQKQQAEERIRMYANICLEFECNYDVIDKVLNGLDQSIQNFKNKQHQWKFALSASYISWKDQLTLKSNAGEKELNSTVRGPCLGGEIVRGNYFWEAALGACFAMTSGSVGKDSPELSYFESNVSVNAIQLVPSFRYKPLGHGASLGLDLPMIYRSGDYSVPDGFELEGNRSMNLGVGISFNWNWEKIGFTHRLSKVSGFQSTVFQAGLHYFF